MAGVFLTPKGEQSPLLTPAAQSTPKQLSPSNLKRYGSRGVHDAGAHHMRIPPGLAQLFNSLEDADDEVKSEGLVQLGITLDFSREDEVQLDWLCALVRQRGIITELCGLISHPLPFIHQTALMLLASFTNDGVDPDAEDSRQMVLAVPSVAPSVARHLMTNDERMIPHALWIAFIVCREMDYVAELSKAGSVRRLKSISKKWPEPEVAELAANCLQLMKETVHAYSINPRVTRPADKIGATWRMQRTYRKYHPIFVTRHFAGLCIQKDWARHLAVEECRQRRSALRIQTYYRRHLGILEGRRRSAAHRIQMNWRVYAALKERKRLFDIKEAHEWVEAEADVWSILREATIARLSDEMELKITEQVLEEMSISIAHEQWVAHIVMREGFQKVLFAAMRIKSLLRRVRHHKKVRLVTKFQNLWRAHCIRQRWRARLIAVGNVRKREALCKATATNAVAAILERTRKEYARAKWAQLRTAIFLAGNLKGKLAALEERREEARLAAVEAARLEAEAEAKRREEEEMAWQAALVELDRVVVAEAARILDVQMMKEEMADFIDFLAEEVVLLKIAEEIEARRKAEEARKLKIAMRAAWKRAEVEGQRLAAIEREKEKDRLAALWAAEFAADLVETSVQDKAWEDSRIASAAADEVRVRAEALAKQRIWEECVRVAKGVLTNVKAFQEREFEREQEEERIRREEEKKRRREAAKARIFKAKSAASMSLNMMAIAEDAEAERVRQAEEAERQAQEAAQFFAEDVMTSVIEKVLADKKEEEAAAAAAQAAAEFMARLMDTVYIEKAEEDAMKLLAEAKAAEEAANAASQRKRDIKRRQQELKEEAARKAAEEAAAKEEAELVAREAAEAAELEAAAKAQAEEAERQAKLEQEEVDRSLADGKKKKKAAKDKRDKKEQVSQDKLKDATSSAASAKKKANDASKTARNSSAAAKAKKSEVIYREAVADEAKMSVETAEAKAGGAAAAAYDPVEVEPAAAEEEPPPPPPPPPEKEITSMGVLHKELRKRLFDEYPYAVFQSWDTDNSGKIEKPELFKAVTEHMHMNVAQSLCDALFDFFDDDLSGILDYQELYDKLARDQKKPPKPLKPKAVPKKEELESPIDEAKRKKKEAEDKKKADALAAAAAKKAAADEKRAEAVAAAAAKKSADEQKKAQAKAQAAERKAEEEKKKADAVVQTSQKKEADESKRAAAAAAAARLKAEKKQKEAKAAKKKAAEDKKKDMEKEETAKEAQEKTAEAERKVKERKAAAAAAAAEKAAEIERKKTEKQKEEERQVAENAQKVAAKAAEIEQRRKDRQEAAAAAVAARALEQEQRKAEAAELAARRAALKKEDDERRRAERKATQEKAVQEAAARKAAKERSPNRTRTPPKQKPEDGTQETILTPRSRVRAEIAAIETHRRLAELGVVGSEPVQPLRAHRGGESINTDTERAAGLPPARSFPNPANQQMAWMPSTGKPPGGSQRAAAGFFLPPMLEEVGTNLLLQQMSMLPPSGMAASSLYNLPDISSAQQLPQLRSGHIPQAFVEGGPGPRIPPGAARQGPSRTPGSAGRAKPRQGFGRPPAAPGSAPRVMEHPRSYLPPTELTDRITRLRQQHAAMGIVTQGIGNTLGSMPAQRKMAPSSSAPQLVPRAGTGYGTGLERLLSP